MRVTQDAAEKAACKWANMGGRKAFRVVLRGCEGKGRRYLQRPDYRGEWQDCCVSWLTKSVFLIMEDAIASEDFTGAALRKVITEGKRLLPVVD